MYTVAFSPDGQLLASGGADNAVILWDVPRQAEIRTLIGHGDWVKSVAFSPDGQLLASVAMDGSLKLWEVSSGINVTSRKQNDRMETVTFSLHGDMLATSGHIDGFIDLWTVSKKHIRHANRISGHLSAVSSIAFSPDGIMLASAGDDDTVKLWNIDDRSEVKSITEHSSDVRSVVFSPDGKTLASGSKDNTVKLLEIPSGNVLTTLAHDYVEAVAFSPDGQTLASAGADHTVKLWSAASWSELASLRGHHSGVTSVAFSPDGRTLASGSRDRTVLLWNLSYFNIESVPIAKLAEKQKVLEVEEPEDPPITILTEEAEASVSESERRLPHPDTTPPTISLNRSITDGMRADAAQFTVQGSVTDDNGVDEIRVNGRKVRVSENGVFAATVQLSGGENSIRVTATDTSGNMDTDQFMIVHDGTRRRQDTTPPTISISSPIERIWHVTADRFAVQGSVTDDNDVNEVRVNDVAVMVSEDSVFAETVRLFESENLIRVTATDTSGNMDTNQFTIVRDTTGPDINILSPAGSSERGFQPPVVPPAEAVLVSGTVTDPSGVAGVKVNDIEAQVIGNRFEATVPLISGHDLIRVAATDTLGNQAFKSITYSPPIPQPRKDYALLFAVDIYDHWPRLRFPMADALNISRDLENIYGFQVELVQNPTKMDIHRILREYAQKDFAPEDQLLIFFAGHGDFDAVTNMGYLVCQDTKKPEDDSFKLSYFSHSDFRDIIDRMSCEHILLVMDTCYSGTFDERLAMRGEAENISNSLSQADIKRIMTYTTRWYLTSGANERVPDDSLFIRALLDALRSKGGRDNILTIEEILTYLKDLGNPKPCSGEFGRNAPGSDFLFIAQ